MIRRWMRPLVAVLTLLLGQAGTARAAVGDFCARSANAAARDIEHGGAVPRYVSASSDNEQRSAPVGGAEQPRCAAAMAIPEATVVSSVSRTIAPAMRMRDATGSVGFVPPPPFHPPKRS